jgi:O-antigen/teichoic acid export membrane protein
VNGETLHVLARRGMRHLFMRQIVTTAVTMAGGVVLARVLSPEQFGTYAIATFIVNIFMIFGDFGLGPAFIQRTTPPSHEDLQTSFTLQFCLITTVVILTWTVAPWIVRFYPSLSGNGVKLARTLSLLLYIPVFHSISAVQLERSLNFKPVAWAEGVGMSLYQVVAVVGALEGLGVWSFVVATFAAGIAGLVVMYHAAPWPIRLRFNFAEMRRILKHGISFQSASIVVLVSQWVTPAVVGTFVGPQAVGYLGLAFANARRPLLLAESVMRVSFPHFSRLRDDMKKLHNTLDDYLIGFLWIMTLWTGFLWCCSMPLVAFIYSPKWLPAVPAFVIFGMALPLDIIAWILGLSYRATDQNWTAVRVFSVRTTLNIGLAVLLVPRIGFIGVPWAYLVANLVCGVLLLRGFAAGLLARVVRGAWWLLPSTVTAYLCGRISMQILAPAESAQPLQQLLVGAVPFAAAYLLCSFVLAPRQYRNRFLDSARNVLNTTSFRIQRTLAVRPVRISDL